jgi:hypothetical protein
MGRAADDHRVNGGATAATGGVTTTLSRRGMPAMEGRRWSYKKGRVACHCKRRAVRMRVATGGGDVMRRRLREERSDSRKGISGGGVWWRWWEQFHGLLVARGIAGRIVTALRDKGSAKAVATALAPLPVCASRRALMSAICSRTRASVSGAGASEFC